jgi:hypothetical protein
MNAARLQIRKQYATGSTLLSELNLPNTGAYQKWQTVYTTVNLQKGPQVVRVLSSSPTGDVWNINWLQFSIAAPVLTSTVEKTALTEEDSIITKGELSALIKPNPVHEQFTLSVQTDFTGPVRIELVDLNGRVKKQYLINKEKAGWLQTTLPAGDLTEGVYIMRLRIQNYHATAKLIKL